MNFLDKINTGFTWNLGAIVGVLAIVGAILSNPSVLAAISTIFTSGPIAGKLAAIGVLFAIIATAIGKPPATST